MAKDLESIVPIGLAFEPVDQPVQIKEPPSALSSQDKNELCECETIIERGWRTFVEVGNALATIRNKGLYREGYATFESYCRKRWQYGKAHAYRLIAAAEVLKHLSPIGDNVPTSESQVRPLLGLEKGDVLKAWQRATEAAQGGTVTAKLVKKAAAELKSNSSAKKRRSAARFNRARSEEGLAKKTSALVLLKEVEDKVRSGQDRKAILRLLARLKKCVQDIEIG